MECFEEVRVGLLPALTRGVAESRMFIMTSTVHADLYNLLFSPFRKLLNCSAGDFIPFGTGRAESFFEVVAIQLFLAAQQYL